MSRGPWPDPIHAAYLRMIEEKRKPQRDGPYVVPSNRQLRNRARHEVAPNDIEETS